jgi:hypothetical protein
LLLAVEMEAPLFFVVTNFFQKPNKTWNKSSINQPTLLLGAIICPTNLFGCIKAFEAARNIKEMWLWRRLILPCKENERSCARESDNYFPHFLTCPADIISTWSCNPASQWTAARSKRSQLDLGYGEG